LHGAVADEPREVEDGAVDVSGGEEHDVGVLPYGKY